MRIGAPALACACVLVLHAGEASQALWPGSRYTEQDRDHAVERGLRFISKIAGDPKAFARWGHDLLWCFYSISATSKNPKLREMARNMGHERAVEWRRDHPQPPEDDPIDLYNFVYGDIAAAGLGVPGDKIRERVRSAVSRYTAVDFVKFDPAREPPPADIPKECPQCDYKNRRGAAKCEKCGTALEFESRYEVWLDALIRTHTGDLYGVKLGASYDDVLRWIKWMRPYPSFKKADSEDAFYAAYAVTHLIYTLNDYHTYRLSPAWLPVEFQYLKRNLPRAIAQKDPEMLGEFMDTLRAFGMSENDAVMRRALQYELSHQNADGSWGDVQSEDLYTRYHSTWTVVDGLRDYQFLGEQLRRPEVIDIINPRAAGKW